QVAAEFRLHLVVKRGIVLDVVAESPHDLSENLRVGGEIMQNPKSIRVEGRQHRRSVSRVLILQVLQQLFLGALLKLVRCVDQVEKNYGKWNRAVSHNLVGKYARWRPHRLYRKFRLGNFLKRGNWLCLSVFFYLEVVLGKPGYMLIKATVDQDLLPRAGTVQNYHWDGYQLSANCELGNRWRRRALLPHHSRRKRGEHTGR